MLMQIVEYMVHNGLIKDMPVCRNTPFNTVLHIDSLCVFSQKQKGISYGFQTFTQQVLCR